MNPVPAPNSAPRRVPNHLRSKLCAKHLDLSTADRTQLPWAVVWHPVHAGLFIKSDRALMRIPVDSEREPGPLSVWLLAALFVLVPLLTGCGSTLWTSQSALAVVSQDDTALRLRGDFNAAYYRFDSTESMTFVLIEGPEDQPVQAAVIRLMWSPKAGKTPINPDATNATMQYIVFADRRLSEGLFREVGVYSGAGYLYLNDDPGESRLTASLWEADLLLADRSERFKDLLGQSRLRGSFTAERNSAKVQELITTLNLRVTERLGYPRLVKSDAFESQTRR